MKISEEFSKYAPEYTTYNIIQQKVIQKLLTTLNSHPKDILDLGCGSGSLVNAIDWDYDSFLGVDFAKGMLELHPTSNKIKCMHGDFNDEELFKTFLVKQFEHVFSASALQWAKDIEKVFTCIESLKVPVSLALFSSGTFISLHKTAGLDSILEDADTIKKLADKYFDAEIETIKYKLEFDSVREMFRYIKKSGVSAGRNVLRYKQTKKLMNEYPLSYLEFEVIFITSR